MSVRDLDLGGVVLAVEDTGAGVPVLMLHGNPDSRDLWDGVVGELGAAPLRLLRPDMPGFGASPAAPAGFDYTADSTVPLWDAALDALGVEAPLVAVLHDFGGPWFLPWVARNPERVRGLVLCNTLLWPGYRWHFWARVWQTPVLGELAGAASNAALFRWEMRRGSEGLPAAYCDAVSAAATPAMRAAVLRTYRSHADPAQVWAAEWPRLLEVLPDIPSRVVWGMRDPYLPTHMAERFGVPVHALDHAGHWSPVEAPDAVVRALRAVLAEGSDPVTLP